MHHSPPQMLNSYLIKGERRNLSLCLFYEPQSQYIVNQSGTAKETVSPEIGKNNETLFCFICMETQDRTSITVHSEPQSQYIENQSGTAKGTVSPEIGKNIETLCCFICMETQDRTLIDINHHQITMN